MQVNFDNFLIRPLSAEDLLQYFKLIETNRKRLEDFFVGTVSKTMTIEDTAIFVQEILKKADQRTYFPFLIVNTSENSLVGFIDIKNIDWNIPKAEIGCYIDQEYANKGISKKAISLFTQFCFSNFKFNKLFLRTHKSNHAAQKVAESCGFELEGTIRRDYKTTAGELVDLLYYGKLSPEYTLLTSFQLTR